MAASGGSQHCCVFVGNIPYDASEEQLIQICEEVGPVVSFRLVLDRETGKPKGYGFCEYKDEETALSARRNLQGYDINGRQLRVDFAENDKGADRNREQIKGRGGPGFTSTNDAHKALSEPPVLGDSSLHQPIGHSLAATAASTMARAFGGSQFSRLPVMHNGLQNFSALGNDPLTQYLAKMSRQQLIEIMYEMKTLATQNKALAQQLLQGCPKLPKALFQAQIMLGMVTPQMMQMVNTRQPSSLVTQPALQNNIPNQNPLLVGPLTRPPESQVLCTLQNPVILQQLTSISEQQLPVQPAFQHPLPPQPQTLLPGTVPGKSGNTTPPQTFGGLSNQPQVSPRLTSKTLISQVQPPILQQSRTPGGANVCQHPQSLLQVGHQQSHLLQSGASNYMVLRNRLHSLPREAGTYAIGGNDLTSLPRGSMHATPGVGLTPQTGTRGEISEVLNHRAKRPKLEDGGGAYLAVTDTFSTISSVPAQPVVPGSVPGSQMANADGLQHSEKQIPLLPPEMEPALIQQVMNLTPEQLSSLPLEQQQQVLQLQQMLVRQNL